MRLNLIMGNKSERIPRLMGELKTQGILDYDMWPGIYMPSIKASINAAHKQIVRYAKLAQWPCVTIAEDDIKFTHENSWNYYVSQLPSDYDLFLSMCFLGQPDENNIVKDFTGMTLYTVHERFYDSFLSVPDDDHIDRLLGGLGKYVVCNPFVATQYDGISANTGKFETYGELTKDRNFYTG